MVKIKLAGNELNQNFKWYLPLDLPLLKTLKEKNLIPFTFRVGVLLEL